MKNLLPLTILLLASLPALGQVTAFEADQLRSRLTPLGAERAGNASGTIPEWRGGLTGPPSCHAPGARYCDPYAEDRAYATITAVQLDQWRDSLAAGQIEMLLRHPQSYRIHLYPSRRSFANPGAVYEAAYRNATSAVLAPSGNALRGASLAVPFPIPKDGVEPMWNHRLRYRGAGFSRWMSQASVTASGEANLVELREDAAFPYAHAQASDKGVAVYWLQFVLQPERLHGYLTLVHDFLDPENNPLLAWRQVPNVLRARKERSYGADSPAMLSDDLRFDDQLDAWFGSPERYTWRIIARRELIVPYNSYALHSGRNSLRDAIRPGHLEPRLVRHELHRVWVVEANLKPAQRHRHKRRTFYIDEDSWQILMVDLYDGTDRLWRWQEVHTLMAYDSLVLMPALEAIYDFDSARYLVQGIDEGDPERIERDFDSKHFTPGGARAQAPR